MLLNCESQFSTYHVITNKATAVSCTTITRPPQSSAGVGESPEMLKNLMPTWIICLHFLGVWNWWKRSYVSHTIVGWLVTAAVNEHRAQLRCAYNPDDVVQRLPTLGPQSFRCFLGFTLFSREEKLLMWPFTAATEPFWWSFWCSLLRETPFLL